MTLVNNGFTKVNARRRKCKNASRNSPRVFLTGVVDARDHGIPAGRPGKSGMWSWSHDNRSRLILSACDTAGAATASASREAGIATGGNYALDGLVRAFVGAGARTVVASHWPVPDDFDATKRLISGMLGAGPGEPLARALGRAQQGLMDDAPPPIPFIGRRSSSSGTEQSH